MPTLTLGDELRRLRTAAGLTQQQVAAALGVTQPNVQHMEAGRRGIGTAHAVYTLADLFGVPVEHFRPFVRNYSQPARKGNRK